MDIQDYVMFCRLAAAESLSSVAQELGVTPGTVSKRLQALEDHHQVRLFVRNTRSIGITDEGRVILSEARRMIEAHEAMAALLEDRKSKPCGLLRIAAPSVFAERFVAPAVTTVLGRFPGLDVELCIRDDKVGITEERFDLVVRTGVLADSSLVCKRLASCPQVLVASPDYVARNGRPQSPEELEQHACLSLTDATGWTIVTNERKCVVRVGSRLRANSNELLLRAALDGLGVALISDFVAWPAVSRGQLVTLLTNYQIQPDAAVWAVYPSGKLVLPKLRVMLDELADRFRQIGEKAGEPGHEIRAEGGAAVREVVNGTTSGLPDRQKAAQHPPARRRARRVAGH